jgi:hypothetical protein
MAFCAIRFHNSVEALIAHVKEHRRKWVEDVKAVWVHSGAEERQISSEGYAFAPRFSANGKKLYYLVRRGAAAGVVDSSMRAGELWMTELDSGRSGQMLRCHRLLEPCVGRLG